MAFGQNRYARNAAIRLEMMKVDVQEGRTCIGHAASQGRLDVVDVIETLGSAVRFATFFVPGSLGALEGANTAAFAALGLGAPAGLAFSLLRRLRQVVWIGLGVLVFLLARARMRLAPEAPA